MFQCGHRHRYRSLNKSLICSYFNREKNGNENLFSMKLRKRSIEISSNEETSKKRRQRIVEENELTRIEDLPGELWFEIFSYFDGQSLVKQFSQLNSFIESILNDIRLRIHLNLFDYSTNFFCSNQIRSLTIDYSKMKDDFQFNLNQFVNLSSLQLISINENQLEDLRQFSLKNLQQISIQSKTAKYLTKILCDYFPLVRRIKLNSLGKEFLVQSFDQNHQLSQVQNLTLEGKIKLVKLFRLWPSVGDLRSLTVIDGGIHQCDYWIDEDFINQSEFPSKLSRLHLTIYDDDLSFSNLEKLIPRTFRCLMIDGSMADDDLDEYLSSINWIRLMSRSSFQNRSIQLNLNSYFDPNDSSGLQKTLNRFRKNPFFRDVQIQSKNFFITLNGFIRSEEEQQK